MRCVWNAIGGELGPGRAIRLESFPRFGEGVAILWLLLLLAAAFCGAAPSVPDCPDQAAALLPTADRLIVRFREEAATAFVTPRLALAPSISRLREIRRETIELPLWPEERCGLPFRERLDAAESFDIDRLEAFLASGRRDGAGRAAEFWADADRQFRALRELVEATRR